ncbi:hypothetical protein DLR72_04260 [Vibrio paracholerae]|uniref:Uncharacterized protein n=1 Tax=Vibrio paracholerae TaxID=650003 RepID=A0ABD7FZ54_9VIBR|nr:hypothetical protein DLR72_04260 [Vibrio paracholerae]
MRLLLVTPPWPSPRRGGEKDKSPLEGEGKKTTLLKKGGAQNSPPLLKRDGTMFEFLPVGRK